jgi:hypothetical protein
VDKTAGIITTTTETTWTPLFDPTYERLNIHHEPRALVCDQNFSLSQLLPLLYRPKTCIVNIQDLEFILSGCLRAARHVRGATHPVRCLQNKTSIFPGFLFAYTSSRSFTKVLALIVSILKLRQINRSFFP